MNKAIALFVLSLGYSAFAAEPYDQKLEFIETTGSQWIDTGLSLNYKHSRARVNVRILEAPPAGKRITFAGATGVKGTDDSTSSFCVSVDNPKNDGGYRWVCSFTGSSQDPYCWPNNGTGIKDYLTNFEIENREKLHTANVAYYGTNKYGRVSGHLAGGYYKAPDKICPYTYYIGAANNAGEGLLTPEGSLPKMQWFGAKFWTNDELVGDFIPVLKNGVAGFYDNITERFFPSQGAEDFVAPVEVLWTGASGNGDLTDGNNWQGGVAPSTIRQVAVFPADTKILVTVDAACAALNNVGAIRLGDGACFELNGISAKSSFYPAVGGTGQLNFVGESSSNTELHSFASLQNFYGECMVSNIYFYPRTEYSTGEAGRSKMIVSLGGSQRFYFYDYTTPHGEIHLRKTGQFMFSGDDSDNDATWIFDAGNTGDHHNGGGAWTMNGQVIGNQEGCNTFNPYSGKYMSFEKEPKNLYYTQIEGGLNIRILTQIHSLPRASGTPFYGSTSKVAGAVGTGQEMANIRMAANRTLSFGCADALDEHAFVQFGYAEGVAAQNDNVLDLGGYDNRVGTLAVWASTFDPATMWNPNLAITSAAPAVLTIRGNMRCDGADHVFPGLVRGAAGVKLDSSVDVMQYAWNWPDKSAPGKIKFNAPGSDTTGTLAVNRGTMEIMPTATFSNLSEVVVSGEGVMNINSPDVATANNDFIVRIKDDTATLFLADGVDLVAYTAEIPDGEYFLPGTYSGTEKEGVTYTPYLKGEGTLTVRNYGKPWSGWPEAGTTNRVMILSGTAVTIEDSDIPKVAALEEVVCGTGVTIDCLVTGVTPLVLTPNFVGDVKIRYWGNGPSDEVVISGDNSGLVAPGGFVLSNCQATVTHRYGLGTVATAPAEIHSLNNVSRSSLFFDGETVTQNDVELQFFAAAVFGHQDPNVEFIQNNNVTVSNTEASPSVRRMSLKNKILLTGGHEMRVSSISMQENAVLTIEENATLYANGNFGSGSYVINGRYVGNMAIEQCMHLLKTGRDNALQVPNFFTYDGSLMAFEFDLNGHNQSINRIYGNEYPKDSNWSAQQTMPVLSETPATLSITGSVAAATKCKSGIKFLGAASCRIACGDTQDNVFGKGVCRTTGSLTMDSGKLTLERGFTWLGSEVQLNGGTLIVDADSTTNVFGFASGLDKSKACLKVNGGALQLNTAHSVTTTVYCVQSVADGTYLDAGVYSAPYGGWLTGTGQLRVLHKGPRPGAIFIVK